MADYYNESELVELCKTRFMASIWPGNVLLELLQPFGIQHKSITEALEEYAVKNWVSSFATTCKEAISRSGDIRTTYRLRSQKRLDLRLRYRREWRMTTIVKCLCVL